MPFDEVLDVIGTFGRYQKWVVFLLCMHNIHSGFVFLNPVFLLGIPKHRCAVPGYTNDTYAIQSDEHRELVTSAIPTTGGAYDKCRVYSLANSYSRYSTGALRNTTFVSMGNMTTQKCGRWVYDRTVYVETFVSQMDLVCDKAVYVANAGMVFFLGMLVGSLIGGVLSDRFGRKTVLIATAFLMAVASTVNAWSTHYVMFLTMQLVKGGCVIVGYITSYILATELTGKDKRVYPTTVCYFAYVAGLLVLSGIAYALRHWFWIQLVTALPGIIFLSYWWLLPESPRWLLTRGRKTEAVTIIVKAAKWNRARLPQGLLREELLSHDDNTGSSGLAALFATRTLFLRSIMICSHWAGMAFLYYGLSLNAGNLSGDLYLNFALLSLVELPGLALVSLLADRIGRRKLFFLSMLLAGLACISSLLASMFAPDIGALTTVLSLAGKLFATSSGTTIYLYSAELFPTVARNAGMGCASVSARIGAMIAPYLVVMGDSVGGTVGQSLPQILFGVVALLSAFSVLLLPETLNRNMPETVNQGQKMGKKKSALV